MAVSMAVSMAMRRVVPARMLVGMLALGMLIVHVRGGARMRVVFVVVVVIVVVHVAMFVGGRRLGTGGHAVTMG